MSQRPLFSCDQRKPPRARPSLQPRRNRLNPPTKGLQERFSPKAIHSICQHFRLHQEAPLHRVHRLHQGRLRLLVVQGPEDWQQGIYLSYSDHA